MARRQAHFGPALAPAPGRGPDRPSPEAPPSARAQAGGSGSPLQVLVPASRFGSLPPSPVRPLRAGAAQALATALRARCPSARRRGTGPAGFLLRSLRGGDPFACSRPPRRVPNPSCPGASITMMDAPSIPIPFPPLQCSPRGKLTPGHTAVTGLSVTGRECGRKFGNANPILHALPMLSFGLLAGTENRYPRYRLRDRPLESCRRSRYIRLERGV